MQVLLVLFIIYVYEVHLGVELTETIKITIFHFLMLEDFVSLIGMDRSSFVFFKKFYPLETYTTMPGHIEHIFWCVGIILFTFLFKVN